MKKSEKIILALCDRGGFDGWWDSIDNEIQDEILEVIDNIVDEIPTISPCCAYVVDRDEQSELICTNCGDRLEE